MVFVKEWEENYSVCPRCDFHDRIGPSKRFEQLFDDEEFELLPEPQVREDLRLVVQGHQTLYGAVQNRAYANNAERDALINARQIAGQKVLVGVQDFSFMGGSMGIGVGAAFVAGVRAAIEGNCPYILFTGGGRERACRKWILSLMQMPRTMVALQELKRSGFALYRRSHRSDHWRGHRFLRAMLGDVQIAEPGALIGFAGKGSSNKPFARSFLKDFSGPNIFLGKHGMDRYGRFKRSWTRYRQASGMLISYLAPEAKEAARIWTCALRAPCGSGPARPVVKAFASRWPTLALTALLDELRAASGRPQ